MLETSAVKRAGCAGEPPRSRLGLGCCGSVTELVFKVTVSQVGYAPSVNMVYPQLKVTHLNSSLAAAGK